jgi:hypothetical protein
LIGKKEPIKPLKGIKSQKNEAIKRKKPLVPPQKKEKTGLKTNECTPRPQNMVD